MAYRRKILDDLFDAFTITAGTNYVSLYDAVGQMTRYSQASVELFGLPGEYIPDGSDDWADYVHPEDRKKYTSIMGQLLTGGARTYNLTYRVRMKDGDYGLFRFIGAILRNEETNAPELVGGIIRNEGLMDNTDSLTVLRNQYGFFSDLETVIELGQKQVILYLGLVGVAQINENYGYGFGNHVLQQVAWVIQEHAAQYGMIYRMDGANFAVRSDRATPEQLAGVYEDIRQSLLNGVDVEGTKLSLVIGGGLLTTTDSRMSGQSIFTCLRQAYRESKIRRHGQLVDFDGSLGTSAKEELQLIDALRTAIIDDCEGFSLSYQTAWRAGEDRPIGVEALLRYHDDIRGDVEPLRYIPILERDFIFEELGVWIMERAMRDGMRFIEKDNKFILGINVAASQIEDDYFIEELKSTAEETGFPIKNLCIELTRGCRELDAGLLKSRVEELKELGARIIIDDFGSGIASIDFLRDIQPDFIKFDIKYIKDLADNEEDRQIIKHLSELAVACGTEVCIKGVETGEIRDIVESFQVRVMQGFLFGKPVSADELLKAL